LVLAGSAAAAKPTARTLRKSAGGPIVAVAQDNHVAAWLTSAPKRGCNQVHVLSPGKHDRTLPKPPSGATMTCHWGLQGWPTQLAMAAGISTALWTLHQSQGTPFEQIVAASIGGPERQVERLSRASDGTGDWLGGVTGAGKTLAYSWDDVEYVNKLACLSDPRKCKEKIADGGIKIVTRATVAPLPGAGPALLLAASAGRIAYVPATTVHGGRPYTTTNNALPIVDATTGAPVGEATVHGFPIAIALSPHVLAVLTSQGTEHDRISWFSATDGKKLGNALVSGSGAPQLAVNDRLIVYRTGLQLRDVSIRTGRSTKLVKTGVNYVGLSLAHGRLVWAENHNQTGRLRALAVG
jgi:hypothetical protein